ncbi:MAG: DUF2332 domain-containing protein [Candidatus Sericytochromatia bacterium]|nr:DUF2332 domain-containing protein [Candidatus Sericytochromatia bacterium]
MAIPTDGIDATFAWFADKVFGDHSPLYAHLSRHVATAPVIRRLTTAVADGQPLPNLIFAAVHLQLLAGADDPLAAFYPSVTGGPAPSGDPVRAFLAYCARHEAVLLPILQTHRVQTNEVRRSALWLPAMAVAAAAHGGRPLSLVECGASAGLNLLWDRYGYDYGDGLRRGDAASPVQLTSAFVGDHRPHLPKALPQVVGRLGIDLHPVDVHDPAQVLWLRALLWPEQHARAALLQAAVSVARQAPFTMWAGDLLARLPDAIRQVPADAVPVIMHSFTFNQLSEADRDRGDAIIATLGAERDLSRLSIEWLTGDDGPLLTHTAYRRGVAETTPLANVDQHGNWMTWLADAQVGQ